MLDFSIIDIKTVVWIQTSFLGDIVLSTRAFNILKENAPHIKQVLITTSIGKLALKKHPSLDQVLVFEKRNSSMFKAVTELKEALSYLHKDSTLILQVHKSARSSLLSLSLGYRELLIVSLASLGGLTPCRE